MMKRSSMPKSPSHTLLAFCFWCIHLLCLVERCKAQAGTNPKTDSSEVIALNAIFQSWGISAYVTGWNISGEPCSGTALNSSSITNPGIKCNCSFNGGSTCHVTEINLQGLGMGMSGVAWVIPEELQHFTFLTNLDVSDNNIEGSLPSFIGNFTYLRSLDVSYNRLNGSLPPEMGNLSNLQQLDVSYNRLNGSLPPEMGNLSNLQQLYMGSSGLSGEIPSTFSNLRNMKILSASDSHLTKIPDFIGSWNLTELHLSQNYITGPFPAFIGNLTNISSLRLSRNYITGPLPAFIGGLTSMSYFSVSMNAMSGSIPRELGNLRNLIYLYIDSCGLRGEIPSTFANLSKVKILWASDNKFTGKIPDFIGSWPLTDLRMQGNAFEGPIPSSFSKLTLLTDLRLSDVSNGSSTLDFIENMTSLNTLVLRNNTLSGSIPSTIDKHQSLVQMDLSFNNLSGPIPNSLFNMGQLRYLFLGNNSLFGPLPSNKTDMLLNIDLSYNQLSGRFPSWVSDVASNLTLVANNFEFDSSYGSMNCLQRSFPCYRNSPTYHSFAIRCGGPSHPSDTDLYEEDEATLYPVSYKVASTEKWAVSNVGRFIDDSSNGYSRHTKDVTSTTDSWLFQYARLSPGSLRYYGLGLQNGNYTVNLKFAETEFPDTPKLKSVGKRIFNIYLQGTLAWKDFNIQKEARFVNRSIEKEQWVMVYHNVLEIHLLWAGKGTFCIPSPDTYGPAISAIRVTPNFKPRRKKKTALAVGILVSVVLSIVSLVIVLIWKRSKRLRDEEFPGMGPKPNIFSYGELKTASKGFNPANKLGQGGFGPVFKGTLLDGRIVAVKKLSVTSHQGRSQFLAEIAAISAVQHRNLVKLYGCCIEGAKRLLVYEYLENKSLDQALFGESTLHLDWHTRFKICLGTARGLAYLHEESRPRIVHRDVKASNILLDANLNPKISDFGLAKLYDDKISHISTRVAGTIGYIAPEYAMRGHLTEKADTFGFGVVALEIVSGRPNPCENVYPENMYLLEWAWHLHENNRALELVDPTLSSFDEEQVARMISIGLLCIQASPSLRPPMSRVVAMMLGDIEVSTVSSKPGYLTDLPPNHTSSYMSDGTSTALTGVTSSSQKLSPGNASSSPESLLS